MRGLLRLAPKFSFADIRYVPVSIREGHDRHRAALFRQSRDQTTTGQLRVIGMRRKDRRFAKDLPERVPATGLRNVVVFQGSLYGGVGRNAVAGARQRGFLCRGL